jgi:branched-chain amino acid transport system substrate-binding protein
MKNIDRLGSKKLPPGKTGISRRRFVAVSAAGAALPLIRPYGAFAADAEKVIRLGYISPRTGNLGFFGQGDPYLLTECRKALKNGLQIGGKTYKIEILDRDSQSSPARAGQLAKSLISDDKIDFMLVVSTPEVVNPVADVCEAASMPCVSTVEPWESWYYGRGAKPGQPSPFKWTFHFSFGGAQFAKTYISEWRQIPTNKKVGVMYPNDADGNAVRGFLPDAFKKAGFTVVDPGPFQDGTSDYSTQISMLKSEHCEIINALVLPPDFATFWRQAAQQGLTRIVRIAQPAKAGSSPTEITNLGELGDNLCVCAPWNPAFPYKSPVTGLNSKELAEGYEKFSGRQVTQQLGASMAEFDVGIAALRAATNPLEKTSLANAIRTLKTITTVGPVNFNVGPMPHVIALTYFVGTQYQKTKPGSRWKVEQVVIENSELPDVPIASKIIPYNGIA